MKIEIQDVKVLNQTINWKDKNTGEPKSFDKYYQYGFMFLGDEKYPEKMEISLQFNDETKQALPYEPGIYELDENSFYIDRNKKLALAGNLSLRKIK
jgi:hypothetical protein